MLRNYLLISLRKASRDWLYSVINILGLAIGIASFLFIVKFVGKELYIDQFHKDPERIYRVSSDWKWNDFEGRFAGTPPALGTSLIENFEDLEYVTRVRPYREIRVKLDDNIYIEHNTISVDSSFLKIFNFKLLEGSPDRLFTAKNRVVLPESYAKKYFGAEPALGKVLKIVVGGNESEFEVEAVIEDAPLDSHINYGIMLPIMWDENVAYMEWSWVWSNLVTYIKFSDGFFAEDLEAKFPDLVNNNAGYAIERITGNSLEEFFKNGNRIEYYLESLSELYYSADNSLGPVGNRTYIYVFAGIASLILLLACINYMNLTTSRSLKRVREVAVRKVVGSRRSQLLTQFLIESLIYSLLATVLAVFLGELLYTSLSDSFGLRWDLTPLSDGYSILKILGISVAVGILAGIYPAAVLSAHKPVKALKGINMEGENKSLLRNSMVVVQFFISFGIIIMAFTVNHQMAFLQNRELGFDKERLLVVNNVSFLENEEYFKNEILGLSEVNSAALSNIIPGKGGNYELFKKLEDADPDYLMLLINADPDFIKTYGIEMVKGNNFSERDVNAELPRTIMSEKAVITFDFSTEEVMGQKIMGLDNGREMEVSGIFKDLDFNISREEKPTIVIRPYSTDGDPDVSFVDYLSIRVESGNLVSTMSKVEEIWNQQESRVPFNYSFYDQIFNHNYKTEKRLSGLLNVFSIIAVAIGLLGLIGLISYNTQQMKKSIGIRKVFGASIGNVLFLLTKDFIRLLIIAFAIAIPVVNYFIKDWLNEFIYKIEINPWLFVIPGAIVLTIALITIWTQSLNAAMANPAQVVRNE